MRWRARLIEHRVSACLPGSAAQSGREPPAHAATEHPESGFTLVELLVVLAILGLLVALATPQVLKYLDSSKVSTAKIEVDNLSAALDLFKIDMERYPTTEEGLEALVTAPPGADKWRGPYVKKNTSFNDPWGHPWNYRCPGEHGEFDLYSSGPEKGGSAGASQVIANW